MPGREFWRLAWDSVAAHPLRSGLTTLGIVIGIASVILLTSLGEGTRRAIAADFSMFGTNVMAIHRGKTTTSGIPGAVVATTRRLTIEDSEALKRVAGVEQVVPVAFGSARVEAGERGRSVVIYGVTAEVPAVWKFEVRQGRFLPAGDPRRAAPLAVLGPTLKRELFGETNALGERVRIGGRRFLVIGVMASKGQLLGFDMDDTAYIPVASAQSLFNTEELLEIDLSFSREAAPARVKAGAREALMRRHGGQEDFTVTTQTEMLDVLDRVMAVVTLAVGGIGAISLLVGAIGILTMTWISVGERTSEIGLVKAIGATPAQIARLFLLEAALLSLAGGVLGVAAGMGIGAVIRWAVPTISLHTAPGFVAAALAVSLAVGLAGGVLPARRAARLDPVEALRAE
ncbi:MAG TPA: ABC transporter permease [Thermoanaerobaculia bacterium]|nr:ABC transporter permease [Thermoanaerobaculia bacterium]